VGGLSVITRALATKTPLEVHDGFDPDAVLDAARRGANLVSLVPTALHRLGAGAASFRQVVLGGSAPPSVLPANAHVTYGLTETGSGVVYDGFALDGVEVAIGEEGEIALRGPMLTRGYRDGTATGDLAGWLHTRDAGRLEADGRLAVLGRLDECVISGGEKIWPQAVEQVLLGDDTIAEIAVTGLADLEWGQRLVALAVAAPGREPRLEGLRERVRAELGATSAPKALVLVEALPRTAIGKIARAEVAKLAAEAFAS
jgi:O-succinylbenzoic acid--CoA ligase